MKSYEQNYFQIIKLLKKQKIGVGNLFRSGNYQKN